MNAYPVHISQGVQLIDKSAQFIQFFVRGHMVNTESIEILSELRFLFNDVFTRKIIDIYLSKRISGYQVFQRLSDFISVQYPVKTVLNGAEALNVRFHVYLNIKLAGISVQNASGLSGIGSSVKPRLILAFA